MTSDPHQHVDVTDDPLLLLTVDQLLESLPKSLWQTAVQHLCQKGVAVLELPNPRSSNDNDNNDTAITMTTRRLQQIHQEAFDTARQAMDHIHHDRHSNNRINMNLIKMIPPNADSAHANGFHFAGGMSSRYNAHREGFVFSDDNADGMTRMKDDLEEIGDSCSKCNNHIDSDDDDDVTSTGTAAADVAFHRAQRNMFQSMHGIASHILDAMETAMELPSPHWFQQHLGPTQTCSQWHMKRYVTTNTNTNTAANTTQQQQQQDGDDDTTNSNNTQPLKLERTESGQAILLPMHTDPSLISVVIHDWSSSLSKPSSSDDSQTSSATNNNNNNTMMGLQVLDPHVDSTWRDLHHSNSNNDESSVVLATIFGGSVLSHITDRTWPAAKHRVVQQPQEDTINTNSNSSRMAATLFVRPQPKALLPTPLPSPTILGKASNNNNKPPITFGTWLQRVAKNYESKKKSSSTTKKKETAVVEHAGSIPATTTLPRQQKLYRTNLPTHDVSRSDNPTTDTANRTSTETALASACSDDDDDNKGKDKTLTEVNVDQEDPFAAFGTHDDDDNDGDDDHGKTKTREEAEEQDPFGAFGSDDDDEDGDSGEAAPVAEASVAIVAKSLIDAANQKLAETSGGIARDNLSIPGEEQQQHVDLSYLKPLKLSTWPPPQYQGAILLVSALPVGGGRGYVATQPIPSGTLVLVEEPMMEWPDEQLGKKLDMISVKQLLLHPDAQTLVHDFEEFHPTKEDVDDALRSEESDLDEATQEQILKMMRLMEAEYNPSQKSKGEDLLLATGNTDDAEIGEEAEGTENIIDLLVSLADSRSLQSRDGSALGKVDIVRLLLALRYNGLESGVYRHVAMLNHDDYPNCVKFMPDDTKPYSEVRTTRFVAAGDTLTISYLPRITCHASRRRHLWDQHRFDIGTRHLKGQHYKMELVGNTLPPSPLFKSDDDASVTRRVERATKELERMQMELAADIEEGGSDGTFETAKALELSSFELCIQAADELLQNSEHILLIPALLLHVDACASVLLDPNLTNAARMGVLARQTHSIYRLLPLQESLLGRDHFDLARSHLDLVNAIEELLSRSAKHLYQLKIPSLDSFSRWSSLERQSRKEHNRIKGLYPQHNSPADSTTAAKHNM